MALPPPTPAYIFRGHNAPIHSVAFVRRNTRLVTGDAEGWIVVWNLDLRRPVAVWKAHEGSVLGVGEWGARRLITHGKDNQILVWRLGASDEGHLSVALPAENPAQHRQQPWIEHALPVNSLNFCPFAHRTIRSLPQDLGSHIPWQGNNNDALLIGVPNAVDNEAVDLFQLPSQWRVCTIPGPKVEGAAAKVGMVMALSVLFLEGKLTVLVGYESGHVMVTQYVEGEDWRVRYLSQPHSQPVLGLDVLPDKKAFYTSSADANVVKHPLAGLPTTHMPTAPVVPSHPPPTISHPPGTGGLSAQFATLSAASDTARPPQSAPSHEAEIITTPLKVSQTKHSGQQGVRVRDDGKIFAAAGWDGRVRVYSCKTLQELAVLKWHREGVFAVAFAGVAPQAEKEDDKKDQEDGEHRAPGSEGGTGTEVALRGSGTLAVRRQREEKVAKTHWVAAGSKDGKVSLWEIY